MREIEIKATPRAQEKFDEIINGSKKEILEFFDKLEKKDLEKKSFRLLFNVKEKNFYYKKCKNVYTIFLVEDSDSITVSDFITESEFNRLSSN